MPDWSSSGVFGRLLQGVILNAMEKNTTPTLRDLYPNLSEQELAQAEDNLDRYIALVLGIFERVELDPQPATLAPNVGTLLCNSPRSES